jgi:hypothetical protein
MLLVCFVCVNLFNANMVIGKEKMEFKVLNVSFLRLGFNG